MKILLVSAVVLVDKDGKILITKRPRGKSMAGLWEFPGGKIEKNETPEKALIRELYEELDIEIENSCLAPITFASYSYPKFHLLMPLFVCRKWKGIVRSKEGQILKWTKSQDLQKFPMPPADKPLIPIIRDWV